MADGHLSPLLKAESTTMAFSADKAGEIKVTAPVWARHRPIRIVGAVSINTPIHPFL
jgi:hypothetical protein